MTTMAPPVPVRLGAKPTPYRFSVAEYCLMMKTGILKEGSKVELIRGEVVRKIPQGDAHSMCIAKLTRLLIVQIPPPACVRCQCPVALGDSLPEPDFAVCTPANQRGGKHPTAADLYLVVEIADSSVAEDRTEMLELYAENGIPEYWIVNLPDDCVEVYTQPDSANLRYASRMIYSRTQSVPLKFASLDYGAIPVDSLLP